LSFRAWAINLTWGFSPFRKTYFEPSGFTLKLFYANAAGRGAAPGGGAPGPALGRLLPRLLDAQAEGLRARPGELVAMTLGASTLGWGSCATCVAQHRLVFRELLHCALTCRALALYLAFGARGSGVDRFQNEWFAETLDFHRVLFREQKQPGQAVGLGEGRRE
jgi:hypothetical protein